MEQSKTRFVVSYKMKNDKYIQERYRPYLEEALQHKKHLESLDYVEWVTIREEAEDRNNKFGFETYGDIAKEMGIHL